MQFQSGDIYEGKWFNNSFHGFGKMTYKNNLVFKEYIGDWKNGEFDGMGRLQYSEN